MNQHKVVEQVMLKNGGYATLFYLYEHVLHNPEWESASKTQLASIRRIVQNTNYFTKIRPGLYCVNALSDRLPQQLNLPIHTVGAPSSLPDHSYYQGLLVELGNYEQFTTFVPNQDRNRRFLAKTLGDVTTLEKGYGFTYPEVAKFAHTVDVTWYNTRRLPHAFFEVEHTTGIYNSLRKFVNLRDFYAFFVIVADAARYPEFAAKRDESAFDSIQHRVRFLDYKTLDERRIRPSDIGRR